MTNCPLHFSAVAALETCTRAGPRTLEEGGKEGKRKRGPFRVRIFGVEGAGWCEGGRAVPQNRPAKKKEKNTTATLFINSRRKVENGRKALETTLLYTPKSEVPGAKWKWPETLCNPKLFVYP